MSWFDDFGAGTYQTKTTTVAGGQNIFYDTKFLQFYKENLKLMGFGQRRPLPMNEGKVIQFYRWLQLVTTVAGVTLTEGVNPSATLAYGQNLQATIGEYGAFVQPSSLMAKTHIDGKVSKGIGSMSELLGQNAALMLDTLTQMIVCSNAAMPLRADYATDTGATFDGAVDSATTTTIVDATLITNTDYGDANDDLNQSIVTITGGRSKGQQRVVTDYVQASGTITVSPAWDVTPTAADTFTVTSADAIASGDALSYANVKKARTRLKNYLTPTWPGGYFIGLIDYDAASLLMDDSDWKAVHTYKDQTTGIFEGEIGKFAGVRFIEHSNAFRFPITTRGTAGSAYGPGADGANYSASGSVSAQLILGREAFGVTTLKNEMGNLTDPRVIVKTSGPNTTSDPLNRFSTAGWMIPYVCKGLNPLYAQQIWTYAA